MALLEIKNFSFTYSLSNKPALNNINLKVKRGEFIVVCGSTGSGKSTLLQMFKKEIRPKGKIEGWINYNNSLLEELSFKESVKNFGYVMQSPSAQIVNEKVYSELAFGLENLGVSNELIAIRVAEIANYFGINNWYDKATNSLSGGQMQILNLASVLIMNPKVLLVDEPTAQLDPITASEFIQTLKKLNRDFGITILLVEHRLDELFSVCDRVVMMDKGRIVGDDTPSNIGKLINNEKLFLSLPTLFRISKKLKINNYPLTINDGQRLIEDYDDSIKNIEKEIVTSKNEVLRLKEVYFKYDRMDPDVLSDLNLKVYENEILTIVGSNGSGKSTLLKLLANLIIPYYGKVYLHNTNLRNYKNNDLYFNNLAYLPQNPKDIIFRMTVREELVNQASNQDYVNNIISKLDLNLLLDKHPDDLSGGEIQRVAFAKILLQKPKVILLDEPTKGLDSYLKAVLIEVLKDLVINKITIVIVSHDIEFAAKVSSRVGLLFAGQVYALSDPNTFFSNNFFYTTIANKIARHKYPNVVTEEDVVDIIKLNGGI